MTRTNTPQWLFTVFERPARAETPTVSFFQEHQQRWKKEHQPLGGSNRYGFEEQKNTANDGSIVELGLYLSASKYNSKPNVVGSAILLLFIKSMMH